MLKICSIEGTDVCSEMAALAEKNQEHQEWIGGTMTGVVSDQET
jgi:hypothetical protein